MCGAGLTTSSFEFSLMSLTFSNEELFLSGGLLNFFGNMPPHSFGAFLFALKSYFKAKT
jgi:hypothetical protein